MKVFKIVKRIEAKDLKDALKKEKESEVIEVYHDNRENIVSSNLQGFKN